MAAVNGRLYFATDSGGQQRPWVSDGKAAGTYQLLPGYSNLFEDVNDFFAFAGKTYFFVGGGVFSTDGIYASNGTPEGSRFIRTKSAFAPGPDSLSLSSRSFVRIGDKALFVGFSADAGAEPWITDGTVEGTRLVADIRPGPEGSMTLNTNINAPNEQVLPFAGGVFLSADDGVHGKELWFTDGTAVGTRLLADLVPGPASLAPTMGAVVEDTAFFTTSLGLLRTDGTAPRTAVVSAIKPFDRNREVLDDKLVFTTTGGTLYAISARDDKPPGVLQTVKVFAGRGPFAEIEFSEDVSASTTPRRFACSTEIPVKRSMSSKSAPWGQPESASSWPAHCPRATICWSRSRGRFATSSEIRSRATCGSKGTCFTGMSTATALLPTSTSTALGRS